MYLARQKPFIHTAAIFSLLVVFGKCSAAVHNNDTVTVCTPHVKDVNKTTETLEKFLKNYGSDIVKIYFDPGKLQYTDRQGSVKQYDKENAKNKYALFIYFLVTEKGKAILRYPADADSILSMYILAAKEKHFRIQLEYENLNQCALTVEKLNEDVKHIAIELLNSKLKLGSSMHHICKYLINYADQTDIDLTKLNFKESLAHVLRTFYVPFYSWNRFDTICYHGNTSEIVPQSFSGTIVFVIALMIMLTFPLVAAILPSTMDINTNMYQEYDSPYSFRMLWLTILYKDGTENYHSCDSTLVEIHTLMLQNRFKFQTAVLMAKYISQNFISLISPTCRKVLILIWASLSFNYIVHYCIKSVNDELEDELVTLTTTSTIWNLPEPELVLAYLTSCFFVCFGITKELTFLLAKVSLLKLQQTTIRNKVKVINESATEELDNQQQQKVFNSECEKLHNKYKKSLFTVPEEFVYSVNILTYNSKSKSKFSFIQPFHLLCAQAEGISCFHFRYLRLIDKSLLSLRFWLCVFRESFLLQRSNTDSLSPAYNWEVLLDHPQSLTELKEAVPSQQASGIPLTISKLENKTTQPEIEIETSLTLQSEDVSVLPSCNDTHKMDIAVVHPNKHREHAQSVNPEGNQVRLKDDEERMLSNAGNNKCYNSNIKKFSTLCMCLSLFWPLAFIARKLFTVLIRIPMFPLFILNILLVLLQNIPITIFFKVVIYLFFQRINKKSACEIAVKVIAIFLYIIPLPLYYFFLLKITCITSIQFITQMLVLTFFVGVPFYPEYALSKLIIIVTLLKVLVQAWFDFQETLQIIFKATLQETRIYNPNPSKLPKCVFETVYTNIVTGKGSITLLLTKLCLFIGMFLIAKQSLWLNGEKPNPKVWEMALSSTFLFFTPELFNKLTLTDRAMKEGHITKVVREFLQVPKNANLIKRLFEIGSMPNDPKCLLSARNPTKT